MTKITYGHDSCSACTCVPQVPADYVLESYGLPTEDPLSLLINAYTAPFKLLYHTGKAASKAIRNTAS